MDADLLLRLSRLEKELLQEEVRSDPDRLEGYLHDEFLEIGRSGRLYNKRDVLRLVPGARTAAKIRARDFRIHLIADGLALLTYQSSRVDGAGAPMSLARRSSLWQRTDRGWRLRFHQATPAGSDAGRTV